MLLMNTVKEILNEKESIQRKTKKKSGNMVILTFNFTKVASSIIDKE